MPLEAFIVRLNVQALGCWFGFRILGLGFRVLLGFSLLACGFFLFMRCGLFGLAPGAWSWTRALQVLV